MPSEFIDLTAPARDPRTPKPRGLLPVPPEVEASVADEEARIARKHGFQITPEARKRMRDDFTIQYYYEGSYVASRCTPEGIEVLAVGWDEVCKFLESHPPEARRDVRIETV